MFKVEIIVRFDDHEARFPIPNNNKQPHYKTAEAAKERLHQVGRCGYQMTTGVNASGWIWESKNGNDWTLVWSIAL